MCVSRYQRNRRSAFISSDHYDASLHAVNSTFGLNVDLLESGPPVLVALWGLKDEQRWSVLLKKGGVAHSGRMDGR